MSRRIVGADYVLDCTALHYFIGAGVLLQRLRQLYPLLGERARSHGATNPGPLRIRRYPDMVVISREQTMED